MTAEHFDAVKMLLRQKSLAKARLFCGGVFFYFSALRFFLQRTVPAAPVPAASISVSHRARLLLSPVFGAEELLSASHCAV